MLRMVVAAAAAAPAAAAAVVLSTLPAMVGGFPVGADVRGGTAGGGGCRKWRLSEGSGSEALARL